MSTSYDVPTFNLKAVVKETGVKPDTLRAWERRYGLPRPGRTEGGHRAYSQRDIDTIKWLTARQAQGLSIGRAVELWHTLAAGRDETPQTARGATVSVAAEGTIDDLRRAWVSACLAFDETGAEQILSQAFALHPPETVCLYVLRAGIVQIGQMWETGEATIQQEHFASELATRRLEALVVASPPPTRPGRILIACPPQEQHAFGLLLLTYLLQRQGRAVIFLGANVPIAEMEATIRATEPQLVILSAQQLHTAATLRRMALTLERAGVSIAYGGGVFNRMPDLRAHIPGHFLGAALEQSTQAVAQLIVAPPPHPQAAPPDRTLGETATLFRAHRASIEARVSHALASDIDPDNLAHVNQDVARDILAALELGTPDALDDRVNDWARTLDGPDAARPIARYIDAYLEAIRADLGEHGAPLTAWLARHSTQEERS